MNQILRIFKKDARHHWPEILPSLALLALFTRHELHPWQNSNAFSSLSPYISFSQVATSLRPRSFSGHSSLSELFKENPWLVTASGGSPSPTSGGICWRPNSFSSSSSSLSRFFTCTSFSSTSSASQYFPTSRPSS